MGGVTVLALIEVLDRDGSVRHAVPVHAWPLRVGRALDNDLVLDDTHTAGHHFSIAPGEEGRLWLTVGESLNGVLADGQPLRAGDGWAVPDGPHEAPVQLTAGRTQLRLRLASHALAPERKLVASPVVRQGVPQLLLLTLAVAGVLAFDTWLENDPGLLARAMGSMAVSAVSFGLGWAGLWTLLSKVFTRQGHFSWHLRVMLVAVLAWQAMLAGTALLAFAFSWPWLTDFNFVPGFAIGGVMLYHHLQAVEPHHRVRTLSFAWGSALAGIALSIWFNLQATDRPGSELYMTHLFPPALRVARPVDVERYMQGLMPLQERLDEKAEEDDDHE